MTYKIALGYDNTAGYVDIAPQPACSGILYSEWAYLPAGGIEPQGDAQADLVYNDALLADEFSTLLTSMGINADYWTEVTISLPIDDRTFGDFNAVICQPTSKRYRFWYGGIIFQVRKIEEIV